MNRQEITDTIKARFTSVRERGKVLAQALKVRAEIAAVRRRLRMTFAELGEEVYGKMVAGQAKGWGDAPGLVEFKVRVEGIKVEIGQLEKKLAQIMEGGEKKAAEKSQDESDAEKADEKEGKKKPPQKKADEG